MGKARRRFTREFKASAVRMLVDKGMHLVEVAASLGVHPSCLRQLRKDYASLGQGRFLGNGRLKEKDAEIAMLRRENRRLLAEREILLLRASNRGLNQAAGSVRQVAHICFGEFHEWDV